MKIVIAGAGAVGTHLAMLLSRERNDIILIDEDPARLRKISNDFDIQTLVCSPSSIKGLRKAGVEHADLFIGVTPDEAHNMTSCILASKLGAKRTVARVDNYEYTIPEHREFFKSVGVDSIIYPEVLAGAEIVQNVRHCWTRQWWEVHNGALIMLGVKLRKTAKILDMPLKDICGPDSPYHVVAIKRDGETIIPRGDDSLHDRDVAYFMTTRQYIDYIRDISGKMNYPDVKRIIFMGGSSTAVQAIMMMPENVRVKVIEIDEARCEYLSQKFADNSHVMVFHGDGRDVDLLREEGIQNTEAFAALTDNAEANILTCLAAKRLGVHRTVAMVENLDYVGMAESLDIGSIINKKTFAAGHIYQMMLNADVSNVKCLTIANADVAEFVAAEGCKATQKAVKDLNLPVGVTLGGLVRNGEGLLINGMTRIEPGDSIMAFCIGNALAKLEKYFN